MPTELLNVAEVAKRLDLSVRSVHRIIRLDRLKALKLPGITGAYVIRESDLQDYVRNYRGVA